jgi:hypothetical protein
MGRKVTHRLADMVHGMEFDLETHQRRHVTLCKHWREVRDNLGQPTRLYCPSEAHYADPDVAVADKEKWAKTLCHVHWTREILRQFAVRAAEAEVKREEEKKRMNMTINPEGPFKVHILNEEGKRKASSIALAFDQLLSLIISVSRPDPRFVQPSLRDPAAQGYPTVNEEELKQMISKLQEASFYAKRAMAMLPENQA